MANLSEFLARQKSKRAIGAMQKLIPHPPSFYEQDTALVAQSLLGSYLIRNIEGTRMLGKIVEVEAYLGVTDPACHAAVGITKRTSIFWGKPGIAYIFLIYGIHHCLNVITMPEGKAGCVLIRGLIALSGLTRMQNNRNGKRGIPLADGPAKLCQAFEIDLTLNGTDLTSPDSPLYIASGGTVEEEIIVTKRIGITKATDQPLRFLLKK